MSARRGGVCLGGVCPGREVSGSVHAGICLRGESTPVHAGMHTPPVNRMTDRQV